MLTFMLALYFLSCAAFVNISRNESSNTIQELYNRSPDSIVVFTGDAGRIPAAIKFASNYSHAKLFITGVYSQNTVEKLLNTLNDDSNKNLNIDLDQLEIDYMARNTLENVISTMRYLKQNQSLHKILVISSDYHIIRIKMIMRKIIGNSQHQFYYYGTENDYSKWRNFKILNTEFIKLIRTYLFLVIWDNELELARFPEE